MQDKKQPHATDCLCSTMFQSVCQAIMEISNISVSKQQKSAKISKISHCQPLTHVGQREPESKIEKLQKKWQ
jgi:hypothetical protein